MPPIVFGEDGAVIPESPSTLSICAGVAEGKAHKLSVLALTPPFELPAAQVFPYRLFQVRRQSSPSELG
jgi:hypothetical protein